MTMPADPRTIAEEALRLAKGATPGPYIWARTKQDTRQGCIDWYAENYDHGVEGPIHAVVVPDGDAPIEELCKTVAITGNGPTSEANALLLTHAGTHYAELARAYLELVSDLPHAVGECDCQLTLALPSMVRTEPEAHTAAIARLRALGGG